MNVKNSNMLSLGCISIMALIGISMQANADIKPQYCIIDDDYEQDFNLQCIPEPPIVVKPKPKIEPEPVPVPEPGDPALDRGGYFFHADYDHYSFCDGMFIYDLVQNNNFNYLSLPNAEFVASWNSGAPSTVEAPYPSYAQLYRPDIHCGFSDQFVKRTSFKTSNPPSNDKGFLLIEGFADFESSQRGPIVRAELRYRADPGANVNVELLYRENYTESWQVAKTLTLQSSNHAAWYTISREQLEIAFTMPVDTALRVSWASPLPPYTKRFDIEYANLMNEYCNFVPGDPQNPCN